MKKEMNGINIWNITMNAELRQYINNDNDLKKIWNDVGIAGYGGSLSHGTAGDVIDDIDIFGVFMAGPEHYFGLSKIEQIIRAPVNSKFDVTIYELQKFMRLLLKQNPNIISILWLPENMYIQRNSWGRSLIENREKLLSKQLHKTFCGYAMGQLHRMTRMNTDQAYQGKKRRERFEKFHYDCKNASHLIRLLRMGIEALLTKEINVYRHDASQLKEIKEGKWTLEQVENEAKRLLPLLDESLVKSELPSKVDFDFAQDLLIKAVREELKKKEKWKKFL